MPGQPGHFLSATDKRHTPTKFGLAKRRAGREDRRRKKPWRRGRDETGDRERAVRIGQVDGAAPARGPGLLLRGQPSGRPAARTGQHLPLRHRRRADPSRGGHRRPQSRARPEPLRRHRPHTEGAGLRPRDRLPRRARRHAHGALQLDTSQASAEQQPALAGGGHRLRTRAARPARQPRRPPPRHQLAVRARPARGAAPALRAGRRAHQHGPDRVLRLQARRAARRRPGLRRALPAQSALGDRTARHDRPGPASDRIPR
ncbi:UNVERIFIED_CONTAM: hypothetical protein NCL1_10500 [Trichonephila clavipes]